MEGCTTAEFGIKRNTAGAAGFGAWNWRRQLTNLQMSQKRASRLNKGKEKKKSSLQKKGNLFIEKA